MDRLLMCAALLLSLPPLAAAADPVSPAASPAVRGFHDPTRPPPDFMPGASSAPQAQSDVPAGLVLEAVQRDAKQAFALINGQRLRVGQRIGNARLERLGADTAVLSGPDGQRVLRLAQPVKNTMPPQRPPATLPGQRVVQGEAK